MALLLAEGSPDRVITLQEQEQYVHEALQQLGGNFKKVLLIPPDHTRFYSGAGKLTEICFKLLSPNAHVDIMPALGTHSPMTPEQLRMFFGEEIPLDRFLVHDWRNALTHRGTIPSETIQEWSEGKLQFDVRVEVNKILFEGDYDLILSIGQIVPHEVVGMANYTKNICVGVGGKDTINKSHYLGAVYNAERLMGRADSPPRRVFNYAYHEFLSELPIQFILTVMEKRGESDEMDMRGLYIGNDDETFEAGCRLSQEVNINFVDSPQKRVVAYLPPHEFKSTWLGNKAIYRTRMMIADEGELIILAPGLEEFGEDATNDRLIRKYGYFGTDHTLKQVDANEELQESLGAAAHLIHGTSDRRFKIIYCPGPGVSKDEIESVGYEYGDLNTMLERYPIEQLKDGVNTLADGEEIYYVSNPSLGLWARRELFE